MNILVLLCLVYFGYSVYATVQTDINKRAAHYTTGTDCVVCVHDSLLYMFVVLFSDVCHRVSEILQEMAQCKKQYLENKCTPIEDRVPAMQQQCSAWETYIHLSLRSICSTVR